MRNYYGALTSLANFADYFDLDPLTMAGACADDSASGANGCRGCCEQEWGEKLRRQVGRAIYQAENTLARFLGFPVAPSQFHDEFIKLKRPGWNRKDGRGVNLRLNHRWVSGFGIRTETLAATVNTNRTAVTEYDQTFASDPFAVPLGTTRADLRVYYAAADRATSDRSQYEILRFTADISGTSATLTIPAYMLLQPNQDDCLARGEASSYVETIEVYTVMLEPCEHGHAWGYVADCTPALNAPVPGDPAIQNVKMRLTDPRKGYAIPFPADCTGGEFSSAANTRLEPYGFYLSYVAGYPKNADGSLHPDIAAAVATLAASMLRCDFPACQCDKCAYDLLYAMRDVYRVKVSEGDALGAEGDRWEIMLTKEEIARAPFGKERGALLAYQAVKDLRIGA